MVFFRLFMIIILIVLITIMISIIIQNANQDSSSHKRNVKFANSGGNINKATSNNSKNSFYYDDDKRDSKVTYFSLIEKFNNIMQEYINAVTYNSDYIFTAPAIFDSSIPATGKFLDSMYKCQNKIAEIDKASYNNPADNNFTETVNNLENDWENALNFARSNVSLAIPPEKHSVVKGLVDKVLISGLNDNEGKLARDKLIEIMSKIEYKVPIIGQKGKETVFIDKMLNPSLIKSSFDNIVNIKQLYNENRLAIEK